LCCDECDDIYVGSTKAYAARKYCHQNVCNNPNRAGYNYKVYETIRANGGWSAWCMVPIQVIPNTTKREAEIVEDVWRIKLGAKMNTQKAYQSEDDKKKYNIKYCKEYYIDHNAKIECECGCLVINLSRHKKTKKHIKIMESNAV
jgi:hypothetical protein